MKKGRSTKVFDVFAPLGRAPKTTENHYLEVYDYLNS